MANDFAGEIYSLKKLMKSDCLSFFFFFTLGNEGSIGSDILFLPSKFHNFIE